MSKKTDTPKIDLTKAKAALYKKDYYSFFIDGFAALYPDEEFYDNWHISYFCQLLEDEALRVKNREPKTTDYIVNIPFRACKSLLFTVAYNAWVWTWYPSAKFLAVSVSQELADELARLTRNLIQTEWYQLHFGDVFKLKSDSNSVSNFSNDKGGKRKSVGFGGQIMGSGCDFLIVDDPQTGSSVTSQAERDKTIRTYRKDIFGRVNNAKGVRFIVQQRIHEADLSGFLLANAKNSYQHICIPAILSPRLSPETLKDNYSPEGLFWASFFPKSRLDELLENMGSKDFANQLLQQASPDDGDLFKKEWFKTTISYQNFLDAVGKEPVWNFYIDTATSESEKNAATAIVVAAKIGAYTYVRDVHTMRKEFPEMVKEVMSWKDKYYTSHSKLCIEEKSSGIQLLQVLRKDERKPNLQSLKTGKLSKIERARQATVDCENGRVVLIEGDYTSGFLEQLIGFPNFKDKDMVDAFAYAVNVKVTSPLLMVKNNN